MKDRRLWVKVPKGATSIVLWVQQIAVFGDRRKERGYQERGEWFVHSKTGMVIENMLIVCTGAVKWRQYLVIGLQGYGMRHTQDTHRVEVQLSGRCILMPNRRKICLEMIRSKVDGRT